MDAARRRKFRQAAFVYLHVGLLYEFTIYVLWRADLMPDRGPPLLWLIMGAAIVAFVFWGLWSWRNVWFARIIWGIHALRLPALLEGAFYPAEAAIIPAGLYLVGLFAVLLNLWMLARAGWDL